MQDLLAAELVCGVVYVWLRPPADRDKTNYEEPSCNSGEPNYTACYQEVFDQLAAV